jgi:hypothetical protein
MLFDPTIDWLFQCLAFEADRTIFVTVWELYGKSEKHSVFLKSIIKYFPATIVSSAATTLLNACRDDYGNDCDAQLTVIKELGMTMLRNPPKKD